MFSFFFPRLLFPSIILERYWKEVVDPCSRRGMVWRLINVCWLEAYTTVKARRPGLYAAFFRVKVGQWGVNEESWRSFVAEWKVLFVVFEFESALLCLLALWRGRWDLAWVPTRIAREHGSLPVMLNPVC